MKCALCKLFLHFWYVFLIAVSMTTSNWKNTVMSYFIRQMLCGCGFVNFVVTCHVFVTILYINIVMFFCCIFFILSMFKETLAREDTPI